MTFMESMGQRRSAGPATGSVRRRVVAATYGVSLALLVLVGATAQAQQPAPTSRAAARPAARQIRIGEFKIEGQIQKPQAFYILQRSNLNFEGLELKNSFVPKIIKSVEQAPF